MEPTPRTRSLWNEPGIYGELEEPKAKIQKNVLLPWQLDAALGQDYTMSK